MQACKTCFLKMCDMDSIRQYVTYEVAVLTVNALVISRLDYYNSLFSEVCQVVTYINCRAFRILLQRLSQIIESMLMLHSSSSNFTGCRLITTACSKPQQWSTNFSIGALLALLDPPPL